MTSPSSGVRPMLVSTLCPSRRAQTLAPLPRWQVISRVPSGLAPQALQQPFGDVRWERPWNP